MRLLLLLVLAFPSAGLAVCPRPIAASELLTELDIAERLYESRVIQGGGPEDVQAFLVQQAEVVGAVECASFLITAPVAARVLQVRGLGRYAEGDLDAAARSFAGARYADATVPFGTGYIRAGEPEAELFWRDSIDHPTWVALPASEGTRFVVNGRDQVQRPTGWPVIVQELEPGGRVLRTWSLEGTDTVIITRTAEAAPKVSEEVPVGLVPPPTPRRAPASALLGGSLAVVGAGAAVLGYHLWFYDRLCGSSGCVTSRVGEKTLDGEQVARKAEAGILAGAVVTGIGLAGVAGSGIWLGVSASGAQVGMTGRF